MAFLLAVGLAVFGGCGGTERETPPQELPLVALLADGRLLSGSTAGVEERARVTRAPLRRTSGRLMALTPDRRLIAVLVTSSRPSRGEVVLVTTGSPRIRGRLRLPVDRTTRATTVLAPAPDRLVVLGERSTRAGGQVPVGWVIDTPSLELVARWRVPKAPQRNWTVFDAAAVRETRRLYVSYHGGCGGDSDTCTTGVDIVSWDTGDLLCAEPARSSAGCIDEIHGEVAAVADGVLGTGGDDRSVLRASANGQITQRWASRLDRNHLARLAYDAGRHRVFALGSCLYAGGLARIDVRGGWRWRRGLSSDGRPSMCGERMAAGGGLVVFTEGPESAGGHESEITVVDGETGSVRARLPIPVPALDLALVR